MSDRKLFISLGALLLAIPLLALSFIYIWFSTQFVQLGEWGDTQLLDKNWEVGQALNRCRFDITQEQLLSTTAHVDLIWSRAPDAWHKGTGEYKVMQPKGMTDEIYAGFIVKTARVFVNQQDGGRDTAVYTKNSLTFLIPDRSCQLFK